MIPAFAYCVWLGRHFSKRRKAHWMTFLFFPMVFLVVALFSLIVHGGSLCWNAYLMGLWIGCLVGLLVTNPVPIKIDLVRQRISAPGSWLMMFCLMILYISKCGFDWLVVSMPEHIFELKLMSFGIKGAMTGALFGQALSFWYRFLVADNCSLNKLTNERFARFCGLQRVYSRVERTEDDSCSLVAA